MSTSSSSKNAAYNDGHDPEAPAPTETTPLTGEGAFAQVAATSENIFAHGSSQGHGEPLERQLSQSDADADRIGEELLSVSGGEEAVHEWIKKSLNLLPPLRESRVYEEFYSDETTLQQQEQQLLGSASQGSADLLPTITEGRHGQQLQQPAAMEGGDLRRSRSASDERQSLRPPQNYSGVGAPPPPAAGYSSVRFFDESGVRRVQTYGGSSVRFGSQQHLSSGHLRASGMGTDKVHLTPRRDSGAVGGAYRLPPASGGGGFYGDWGAKGRGNVLMKVACMAAIASAVLVGLLAGLFYMGEKLVGPPRQPLGAYKIVELQEGDAFWHYYNFYIGPDSIGSNGYLNYVGKEKAFEIGIANVSVEAIQVGDVGATTRRRALESMPIANATETPQPDTETFVYMSSAPTENGPRDSIRLEGKRRFNRGLFIIDLHHMPAGCGVWPAFWLTDEANWPVNGEIDIVEGINYQSVAKTALHSTQVCKMDDVPLGTKTGVWDTAVGIPDKKTGVPDMTLRDATNCYVYDPHQWLNQGCVAVEKNGGTLGVPLNKKGGGVYALDWDPINRHIRTYVFTPHSSVPENLADAIRTADLSEDQRVDPDPDSWGLPYGYFPIGEATNCPASHFRNMRLVINMAFCGSVSGNRYHMDCPKQAKKYKTCNDWIKADEEELQEAYWKIKGVYVYEREWVSRWV